MLAVQNFDAENVLFDGVTSKIVTNKISPTKSQNFFYYVFDSVGENNDLYIFLTS